MYGHISITVNDKIRNFQTKRVLMMVVQGYCIAFLGELISYVESDHANYVTNVAFSKPGFQRLVQQLTL